MANRIGGRLRQQTLAKQVLVDAVGLGHAMLVLTKRVCQESRLRPHARGAPLELVAAKRFVDQLFESLHVLRLTPQQVVEPKHLRDQARTKLERKGLGVFRDRSGRSLRNDIAFERAQASGRMYEPLMEVVVELVAGGEVSAIV